jgi:FixJ family two-component response regulator
MNRDREQKDEAQRLKDEIAELRHSSFILPNSSLDKGEKMAPVVNSAPPSKVKATPRILVVDDERALIELVGDVVGTGLPCKLFAARSIADAKNLLAGTPVDLLVTDIHLPDGDGTQLLPLLRQCAPAASAIVITGQPSVDGAITAMREGAVDFLPKPFTADELLACVTKALQRQQLIIKQEKRIEKLRQAVRRLNDARKLVSKKVDLLCNDLITAYGELSKQLDVVRTQENFRKLLAEAKDLEQMLCHAMDWLLRQMGYSNVAIWLTGDDAQYQLGAYMKYTIPGEPALTEALKSGILRTLHHDGFLHYSGDEMRDKISPIERNFIANQTMLGVTCTYLGESLAAVMLFRESGTPFSEEDALALKAIGPLFATALSGIVHDDEDADDDTGTMLDDDVDPKSNKPRRKKESKSDADWWKRGEAPPF